MDADRRRARLDRRPRASPAPTAPATCATATCRRCTTSTGSRSGRPARSATSRSSCTPGSAPSTGIVFPEIERIYNDVAPRPPGAPTPTAMLRTRRRRLATSPPIFFNDFLNHNVDSRRPMWQMMLGGVFDRHPGLKLLLTEIRLDWIPATLQHLDAIYDAAPRRRCRRSASRASTGTATAWPARRSSTRPRWRCATRSASRRSCSGATSRTPRARGPTPTTGCGSRSRACPTTRCGSCWARTPSGSSGSTANRWPRSPSASAHGSRTITSGGGPAVRPELLANFDSRGGFLKPAEGDGQAPAGRQPAPRGLVRRRRHRLSPRYPWTLDGKVAVVTGSASGLGARDGRALRP